MALTYFKMEKIGKLDWKKATHTSLVSQKNVESDILCTSPLA